MVWKWVFRTNTISNGVGGCQIGSLEWLVDSDDKQVSCRDLIVFQSGPLVVAAQRLECWLKRRWMSGEDAT